MTWATLQQLIRIVAQVGGAYLVGENVASGEMYQAAVAGLVNVAAFVWWVVAERQKAAS